MKTLLVAGLLMMAALGCTPRQPLPTYPRMSAEESLKIIRERSARIETLSGEATITLTDSKGESVRLEGAIVLQPPDRARLKAWKFGQAVFDLTIREDGAWAHASPCAEAKPAMRGAGESLRQWVRLLSNDFSPASFIEMSEKLITISTSAPSTQRSDGTVRTLIDRATLTPRRIDFDHNGTVEFALKLEDYRVVESDLVWSFRITAISNTGVVRIDVRDVEINAPLAPAAFKPPAKAEKLP